MSLSPVVYQRIHQDSRDHTMGTPSKFDDLPWHDAKLLNIRMLTSADEQLHAVTLDVRFQTGAAWRPVTVTLVECTLLQTDLDLDGMRVCGHSIWTARCYQDSELKKRLMEKMLNTGSGSLEPYYHFHFSLIPPGGELNIFARDFKIMPGGQPS